MKTKTSIKTPTGCTRPESLFGLWCIEPTRFSEYVAAAKAIDMAALAARRAENRAGGSPSDAMPSLSPGTPKKKGYDVSGGIASFQISGPMTKYETSFQDVLGGTSTMALRQALREAADDDEVDSGMLIIDSPGGTTDGMTDLADDIREFCEQKPCYAYIQDNGCSAAYWAAAQCDKIYANAGANIGCIGVKAALYDTSGKMQQEGVKVYVISSSTPPGVDSMKGAGTPGTEITKDQLQYFQSLADEFNSLFVADIAKGRPNIPDVRALADGRVHIGAKSVSLGLVDEIASLDAAMDDLIKESIMNTEQFKAFAASNADDPTVKTLRAEGHKAGKAEAMTEARSELGKMLAGFPGRAQFAAEQFIKGHDAISAKADFADVLLGENEALATKNAEQAKAIAARADDNPAINTNGAAAAKPKAPEAMNSAEAETAWSALVAEQEKKGLSSSQAMIAAQKLKPEVHAAYVESFNAKK